MKKQSVRLVVYLIVLCILTIVGMMMLIFSQREWSEEIFDLIVLIGAAASILIAIYSVHKSTKESRRLSRMIHDLNSIDSNLVADMNTDEDMRKKLNRIIAMDEQILAELTSHKRATKRVGKKASEKSK